MGKRSWLCVGGGFQITASILTGILLSGILLSVIDSACLADEAIPGAPAAAKPRTFELQLVGPDGKPVAHGEVSVRDNPLTKREQVKVGEFVGNETYRVRIKADADGRIVIERPKSGPYFAVDIETPGYAPYWATWNSYNHKEEVPSKLIAQLDRAWSVGGIVVDKDGKPVKGATINPSIPFKRRPGDEQEIYVGTQIKTNADGKWRFDCVPMSMTDVSVSIRHPDLMPRQLMLTHGEFGLAQGQEPTVKITLEPGIVITGHVTDDAGKPVIGARVFTRESEVKTGDDGGYQLKGCGPGRLRVVVTAKGRAMDMKDLDVVQNMPPVDFAMKPGGKIRIRVVDKEGNPIPKTNVFFQQWRGKQIEYFEFSKVKQYTDKDGVWEWDEAPLDDLEADISPPKGMTLSRQHVKARSEEYVFHPSAELVISGMVTDAKTNEPIKSFRVIPGQRYGNSQLFWNRQQTYTGKDGKYEIRNNRVQGAQVVRVEADGYKPAVSEDIKAEDENVLLDFPLERGQDIQGTVLTPDGKPAEGANVALGINGSQIFIRNGALDHTATFSERVATDKSGKFHFPPQDGEFTILVTHSSGFAKVASNGEWKQDSIKLQPWARIEGTFRTGKKTAPHVTLEFQANDFSTFRADGPRIFFTHATSTDGEGHFVFDRLLPGKGYIGRQMIFMVNEGATEVTSSKRVLVECKGGETLKLDLGGDARQVVGQLQSPQGAKQPVNWRQAQINMHLALTQPQFPKPPAAVLNDRKKAQAWLAQWQASPEGQAWAAMNAANQRIRETMPYFSASADDKGHFKIDDVPPGSYELSLYFMGRVGPQRPMTAHFSVPAAESDQGDAPVDVGTVTVESK